jgi:hypothetical protein
MENSGTAYSHLFPLQNWIILMAVFGFFKTGSLALAQDDHSAKTSSSTNAATNSLDVAQTNSAAKTTLETKLSDLRLGPFVFHPRLAAGFTYDNNILYSTNNKETMPRSPRIGITTVIF